MFVYTYQTQAPNKVEHEPTGKDCICKSICMRLPLAQLMGFLLVHKVFSIFTSQIIECLGLVPGE